MNLTRRWITWTDYVDGERNDSAATVIRPRYPHVHHRKGMVQLVFGGILGQSGRRAPRRRRSRLNRGLRK